MKNNNKYIYNIYTINFFIYAHYNKIYYYFFRSYNLSREYTNK